MTEESEIDKFIEEELEKDIDQSEKIDPQIEEHLSGMGFLYDVVCRKLQEVDRICFSCKKEIDFKEEKLQVLQATNTEKGSVAFVGICNSCYSKLQEEHNKINGGEVKNE